MLYLVDFSIKINGNFNSVHNELIFANSVSECKKIADIICNELSANCRNDIHIFIEA